MKSSAFLINTARGPIVHESALARAIIDGEIAGAGIDVFENEPTPREDILAHPKISLTPHIGASTLEAQEKIGTELAGKILSVLG